MHAQTFIAGVELAEVCRAPAYTVRDFEIVWTVSFIAAYLYVLGSNKFSLAHENRQLVFSRSTNRSCHYNVLF